MNTEMLLLLLLLAVAVAVEAIGVTAVFAHLVNRRRNPAEPHEAAGKPGTFSLLEVDAHGIRIRWSRYFLALAVVIIGSALLNGLLLAAGVWSGMDTVFFGLFIAVAVFNVIVIRDFHKAGRTAGATPLPPSPEASNRPPTEPATTAACPRCRSSLPPGAPQGLCPRCVLGVGLATETEATGLSGPKAPKAPPGTPRPVYEIAAKFPQLELVECLGRGGMGVVYKARQPKLNRFVALKILAPEKGDDPKFADRFLREAQALARLNHPNIVAVHDFGEVDGLYYLLMEFVDGVTLRQLIQSRRITPEEALAIVPRICEALQFAHGKGVVHRDIKPENVLLDRDGQVKIADFGIAKIIGNQGAGSPLTAELQAIGTPHYMAPEQIEKPQTVDHRADIYSLGVVFYELLTGELPLGKFAPPSKKVQVDVRLDEVVLRALEKEPERRYQQATQVKSDIETIAATTVTEAENPAKTRSAKSTPSSSSAPSSSFWRREVMSDSQGNRLGAFACYAAGLMIFILGSWKLTTLDLDRAQLLFGVLLVVIASLLAAALGASMARSGTPEQAAVNEAERRNPDNGWIYFSKQDSRVIVPRRFGILGWTINFGHPLAMIMIGGLLVLVILWLAFPGFLSPRSPNVTVSGFVLDVTTGEPISGARVDDNVYGGLTNRAKAWTDATGYYELKTWNEEHLIEASAPGYSSTTRLLHAQSGKEPVKIDFHLQSTKPEYWKRDERK